MSQENVLTITSAMKELPEGSTSKDLFDKLNGKFGYGVLRAVMSYNTLSSPHEMKD
jgi:hypothetical protein